MTGNGEGGWGQEGGVQSLVPWYYRHGWLGVRNQLSVYPWCAKLYAGENSESTCTHLTVHIVSLRSPCRSLYPELDLSLVVVSVTLCTERDTTSCSFHGFLLQFSKTRICAHCGLSPFPVVQSANGLLVWSESLLVSCKTSVTLCWSLQLCLFSLSSWPDSLAEDVCL